MKIAVVVSCYRVSRHIEAVLSGIGDSVHHILVVDDCCPEGSGDIAARLADPRIEVLRHPVNKGVGGAVVSGYRRALDLGCDVAIKMDGDGQMDPAELPRLIAPLRDNRADYAKGNRFLHSRELKAMPPIRLIGNSALSFLVKAASGQWGVMDPTNGYTAIHRRALEALELDRLSERFFFESDILIQLGIAGLPVADVAMPARYGTEASSLSVTQVMRDFPPLLLRGFVRRLLIRYFLGDFNIASLYLVIGLPLLLFGLGSGAVQWRDAIASGVTRTAGTVMLVAMPTILGFQLLLQAIAYDVQAAPRPRPPPGL